MHQEYNRSFPLARTGYSSTSKVFKTAFSPRQFKNAILASTVFVSSLFAVQAFAVDLDWDTSGTAGIQGGAGTWDVLTTSNWTSDGGASNVTFANGDNVTFGDTGGSVTVTGTVSPGNIVFAADAYVLSGGTINYSGTHSITTSSGQSATINTTLTGSGTLNAFSFGTLNLGGANSFSGTMNVNAAGGLVQNNGAFAGSVNVVDGTYANAGTQTGLVTVSSGATFTNTGTSDGGLTNQSGGIVNAQGTINGAVSNSGTFNLTGDLGGNNTLSNLAGGIFNTTGTKTLTGFTAFSSAGTVDMTGNAAVGDILNIGTATSFLAGGSLNIDVDHNDVSDQIFVTGTVALDGTLAITAIGASGNYVAADHTYTIINNDGTDAVTGTFSNITTNLAFLSPTVDTAGGDGNDVVLLLTNTNVIPDFNPFATTSNQTNFAGAMANFDYSGTAGLEVLRAVNALTNAQVPGAMQQMSGEGFMASQAFGSASAQQFNAIMSFSEPIAGGTTQAYADSPSKMDDTFALVDDTIEAPGSYNTSVWGKVLGGRNSIEADATSEGFTSAFGGIAAGVDISPANSPYGVGLAVGYSRAWYDTDVSTSDIVSDNIHIGINTKAGASNAHETGLGARFAASFTHHMFDSERDVIFGGLTRQADADYEGYTVAADFELRYGFTAHETADQSLVIAPVAALHLLNSANDDFSESGAGGLNLTVDAKQFDSAKTELGLEIGKEYLADTTLVRAAFKASWNHEFSDTATTANMSLSGSPTSYVVSSPDFERDTFAAEAGISAIYANGLSLQLQAEGVWSESSESYTGQTRLSWKM